MVILIHFHSFIAVSFPLLNIALASLHLTYALLYSQTIEILVPLRYSLWYVDMKNNERLLFVSITQNMCKQAKTGNVSPAYVGIPCSIAKGCKRI